MEKFAQIRDEMNHKHIITKGKVVMGVTLLVPLTIYLFLFYSSALYSTFCNDLNYGGGILQHLVYNTALCKAFTAYIPIEIITLGRIDLPAGIFVTVISVIMILLSFFTQHKSQHQRLSVAIISLVVFTFDFLLAAQFATEMHTIQRLTGIDAGELYGVKEIMCDANFWIILALGYIAYLIWVWLLHTVVKWYHELNK